MLTLEPRHFHYFLDFFSLMNVLIKVLMVIVDLFFVVWLECLQRPREP